MLSPWLPTAPGCLLPGESHWEGAEGKGSTVPPFQTALSQGTDPAEHRLGTPQLRPWLGCADPQSPLQG